MRFGPQNGRARSRGGLVLRAKAHLSRRSGRRVSARGRARGGPRAVLVVRITSFRGSGAKARTNNKEQQRRESVRTRQFRHHALCFCCVRTSFALIQQRRWGPGAGCVPGAARAAWAAAAHRRRAPAPKEPQHPRPLRGEESRPSPRTNWTRLSTRGHCAGSGPRGGTQNAVSFAYKAQEAGGHIPPTPPFPTVAPTDVPTVHSLCCQQQQVEALPTVAPTHVPAAHSLC